MQKKSQSLPIDYVMTWSRTILDSGLAATQFPCPEARTASRRDFKMPYPCALSVLCGKFFFPAEWLRHTIRRGHPCGSYGRESAGETPSSPKKSLPGVLRQKNLPERGPGDQTSFLAPAFISSPKPSKRKRTAIPHHRV